MTRVFDLRGSKKRQKQRNNSETSAEETAGKQRRRQWPGISSFVSKLVTLAENDSQFVLFLF